jgi:exosome complex component RRP45
MDVWGMKKIPQDTEDLVSFTIPGFISLFSTVASIRSPWIHLSTMMSRPVSYIPIRDDATTLSLAERQFITRTGLRADGRARNERRPVAVQLSRTDDAATAMVVLGAGTRVHGRVAAELVAPEVARPNEGLVTMSVDLSPAASTSARLATPAATYTSTSTIGTMYPDRTQQRITNHILRTLERCLGGEALDREALCIVPGVLCWKLSVNATILDDSGNATDATVLAAVAALRHYRLPAVEVGPEGTAVIVPVDQKEPLPLPLHYTPLTISFACLDSNDGKSSSSLLLMMDPTDRETLCATGHVTWAMNAHQEILALDSSCEMMLPQLRDCHSQAAAQVPPLSALLEAALEAADATAQSERLRRAQRQSLPLPPKPKFAEDDEDEAVGAPMVDTVPETTTNEEEDEDEAYRRRALDYALGHVATAVRDDPLPKVPPKRGAFFDALVRSAQEDRMDDDEEEETVQLQSEFSQSQPSS